MTWSLFVDSTTSISIEPAARIEDTIKKLKSEYRASSGKPFRYNWGSYRTFRLPIEFVSSADISQINSWWYGNEKLLLKEDSDSQVFSVQISGLDEPVTQFIAPFSDLKKGAIILETY